MSDEVFDIRGDLFLHSPDRDSGLSNRYRQIFARAKEIFVVTAYLTSWDGKLKLSSACEEFRLIAGKDFGITRKSACRDVLKWLPARFKHEFLVASGVEGFHPKAVFWKEGNKKSYALVGSSNLTDAAFRKNFEANVVTPLSAEQYRAVKHWLSDLEVKSETVSPRWLRSYQEAVFERRRKGHRANPTGADAPVFSGGLLPRPSNSSGWIARRRRELRTFATYRSGLENLIRRCAKGAITSQQFYKQLPRYWDQSLGDRLQGKGYTIKGKHSNFQKFSRSLLAVLDARLEDRDDIVAREMDRLARERVPTRRALFSELLCLFFGGEYPLLDTPVRKFRSAKRMRKLAGSSEGADYIYLTRTMRKALKAERNYPAKNLAELDMLIWLTYDPKSKYQNP